VVIKSLTRSYSFLSERMFKIAYLTVFFFWHVIGTRLDGFAVWLLKALDFLLCTAIEKDSGTLGSRLFCKHSRKLLLS